MTKTQTNTSSSSRRWNYLENSSSSSIQIYRVEVQPASQKMLKMLEEEQFSLFHFSASDPILSPFSLLPQEYNITSLLYLLKLFQSGRSQARTQQVVALPEYHYFRFWSKQSLSMATNHSHLNFRLSTGEHPRETRIKYQLLKSFQDFIIFK